MSCLTGLRDMVPESKIFFPPLVRPNSSFFCFAPPGKVMDRLLEQKNGSKCSNEDGITGNVSSDASNSITALPQSSQFIDMTKNLLPSIVDDEKESLSAQAGSPNTEQTRITGNFAGSTSGDT